jgi:hypothetical protein
MREICHPNSIADGVKHDVMAVDMYHFRTLGDLSDLSRRTSGIGMKARRKPHQMALCRPFILFHGLATERPTGAETDLNATFK